MYVWFLQFRGGLTWLLQSPAKSYAAKPHDNMPIFPPNTLGGPYIAPKNIYLRVLTHWGLMTKYGHSIGSHNGLPLSDDTKL